ncbi:unnamed protein product, partial [Phaeothamnion confervicola]
PGALSQFRIAGQPYHRIGPMTPERGETPRFLQLYFSDPVYELALRRSHFPREQLRHDTLSGLREMLRLHHPYVRLFEEAARPGQTYSIVSTQPRRKRWTGKRHAKHRKSAPVKRRVQLDRQQSPRSNISCRRPLSSH